VGVLSLSRMSLFGAWAYIGDICIDNVGGPFIYFLNLTFLVVPVLIMYYDQYNNWFVKELRWI
jgi:hypothetical protein